MSYKRAEGGKIRKKNEGEVMSPEEVDFIWDWLKFRNENLNDYKRVTNIILQARRSVITGSKHAKRNAYNI